MEEVDRCTRDLQCRCLVERFYRRNFAFGHSKLVLSVYILKEPLIDDLRTSHPDERVELRVMPALFERIIQWLEAHRRYYMVAVKSSPACSVKIHLCTMFTVNTCRLKVEMLTTRLFRHKFSDAANTIFGCHELLKQGAMTRRYRPRTKLRYLRDLILECVS